MFTLFNIYFLFHYNCGFQWSLPVINLDYMSFMNYFLDVVGSPVLWTSFVVFLLLNVNGNLLLSLKFLLEHILHFPVKVD